MVMTGAIKCAFFGHMDYCIISFRTEAEIIFQWSRFLFVDGGLQSSTLWCQLEDTFQLIVTPQGMELVMVHIEVISQCLKKYRVEYKACYIFLLDTIQL